MEPFYDRVTAYRLNNIFGRFRYFNTKVDHQNLDFPDVLYYFENMFYPDRTSAASIFLIFHKNTDDSQQKQQMFQVYSPLCHEKLNCATSNAIDQSARGIFIPPPLF